MASCCKAQTAAAACFFGGEKGIEGVVQRIGSHAASRVSYGQFDPVGVRFDADLRQVRPVTSGERNPASGRHGVPGVQNKIEQDLLDLSRFHRYPAEVGSQ